jgi:hypothetical protein
MDKKLGVLAIILLAAILIISLWVLKDSSKPVNCSNINSTSGIDRCLENTVVAKGTLRCDQTDGIKGTGISLNFEDGTRILFLEDYGHLMQNCTDYNAKRVQVIATFHQCSLPDQCAGVGLMDIESVKLAE